MVLIARDLDLHKINGRWSMVELEKEDELWVQLGFARFFGSGERRKLNWFGMVYSAKILDR